MPSPKEECEELMNSILPLAKDMLARYGEFYPYGGFTDSKGEITHVGAKVEGTDHPKSQPLIEIMVEAFRKQAQQDEIKAASIVYDVRIKPPGSELKTDAIQVCLEHRDGFSADVFFPYRIEDKKVIFGTTFAQRRQMQIFREDLPKKD